MKGFVPRKEPKWQKSRTNRTGKKLKLEVNPKSTIKDLEALIAKADTSATEKVDIDKQDTEAKPTAKAGKRSLKALKEADEKESKEERKEQVAKGEIDPSEESIKKGPTPKTRSKLERRSKNYKKAAEHINTSKSYSLKEAVEILPKTSTVKFDASVELHINLGVDPRQADQNIRATVALPHGSGKTLKIAVFAPSEMHEAAKKPVLT